MVTVTEADIGRTAAYAYSEGRGLKRYVRISAIAGDKVIVKDGFLREIDEELVDPALLSWPREIVIESFDSTHFLVREGDRYLDGLGFDEMLNAIIHLTHWRLSSHPAPYHGMKTLKQHEDDRRRILRIPADSTSKEGQQE